jgi:hypothetical protein
MGQRMALRNPHNLYNPDTDKTCCHKDSVLKHCRLMPQYR